MFLSLYLDLYSRLFKGEKNEGGEERERWLLNWFFTFRKLFRHDKGECWKTITGEVAPCYRHPDNPVTMMSMLLRIWPEIDILKRFWSGHKRPSLNPHKNVSFQIIHDKKFKEAEKTRNKMFMKKDMHNFFYWKIMDIK